MSGAIEITGTQLTNALGALDVNFIMGGQSPSETLHKQPARLIAALAEGNESRLRLSLIPLFFNIMNLPYTSGRRQDSSTQPLVLRFNAITLPQSGWVKNTSNMARCQITFPEN